MSVRLFALRSAATAKPLSRRRVTANIFTHIEREKIDATFHGA